MEIWKDIPGFSGYQASNLGRVRTWRKPRRHGLPRSEPAIKAQRTSTRGYRTVCLMVGKASKPVLVHRLVLAAFVGPPSGVQECRHLDGDRTNNRPDNLAWGSAQDNANDRRVHGTQVRMDSHPNSKLTSADVEQIRAHRGFLSSRHLADVFCVSSHTVCLIQSGRSWSLR